MAILAPPCHRPSYPATPAAAFISSTYRHCSTPPSIYSLTITSQLYNQQLPPATSTAQRARIDKSLLRLSVGISEAELWAAACLRVRCFYNFEDDSFGIQDHKKYLAEREFEALKERVAGVRVGFKKVSCIDATLPLSQVTSISDDLSNNCKFSDGEEERVVVGTLDINQCIRLPDEIAGMKPKGIGADFARAYLSNVCVAQELQRNGLGSDLISKAKLVAEEWGISDLYVHVAVDNEPAKNLYIKSGFTLENEEPAWQARFLDRPRRLLLWTGLPSTYDL
ncbi:OLC1v1035331C1 [Oldenlandia corymbosa var. corymbosa]|uniref:OLC1v1035331C1 n=1 Tax=Oldenlandia corymbosa var. corymbosa TaxID=529605 RepID=A0AAV1CV94_OLDCO|nr:OLC1v1035331C1 [Oldenlandia corymbosa var. corymbosa]